MPKIILTSAGTLGDFLPLVRLGRRLRQRGHDVLLAINPAMVPLAEAVELPAVACGLAFGAREARERADVFDFWKEVSADRLDSFADLSDLDSSSRTLLAACSGADLLVASTLQGAAELVHERTGIPWIGVALMPADFPHIGHSPTAAALPEPLFQAWLDQLNRLRVHWGLRSLTRDELNRSTSAPQRVLLASSPHFSEPDLERYPEVRLTGFWFDDGGDWSAPAPLIDFLHCEPPPLLLTLGSAPVADPTRTLAVHAQAAQRLGRRLLVQSGWAGLAQCDWDRHTVLVVGDVPHRWLLPRVEAVIHHGGVGTTAEALRWGLPMLVEPLGNDQFFNARRVLALGVGAAMNPHRLTADGLARVLEAKVLRPDVRQRAVQIGQLLQAEDGLETACTLIEQELRG